MHRLLLAVLVVATAGCGGPSGPLAVGWRFANGRSCADTGVSQILVGGPVSCTCGDAGAPCPNGCRFACEAALGGGADHSVTVTLTDHGTLSADALTASGAALYRGSQEVESLDPVIVDLYFTGGP